ncbi:MAG: ClpXP protease specificity-enhancing factor [Burkholderiales bacterium]|nr:ClpXP protease specificity-enhancing factor [Burkholderiales bacterium]
MEDTLFKSEAEAKPYLVRAVCEWCAESGLTPYLAVRVNEDTRVPTDYVNEDGEIIFNLSERTTHGLTIDNRWILFSARFGGVAREVAIPFSAVAAIFARETGYGLYFNTQQSGAYTAPGMKAPTGKNNEVSDKPKPPKLKLVE